MPRLNNNLLKTIVFFLILFGFHNTLSFFYISWIQSSYTYEITRRQFEEVLPQTSILILGDSYAKFSINPAYINGSFNFALNGENYIETYYKINYYLHDKRTNINLVILPVDLHSFSSYRADRFRDPVFWKRYINYFELGKFKNDSSKYFKFWLFGEIPYLGGFDETIEKILGEEEQSTWKISMGHISHNVELPESLDKEIQTEIIKRAERKFKGKTYLDSDLTTYFIKVLKLLEENDISVVLVWHPTTQYFYSQASQYLPGNNHLNIVEKLLTNYDFSYPILDYHDIFWGKNNLFVNGDHLNSNGAAVFTQILKSDLLEMNLIPSEE